MAYASLTKLRMFETIRRVKGRVEAAETCQEITCSTPTPSGLSAGLAKNFGESDSGAFTRRKREPVILAQYKSSFDLPCRFHVHCSFVAAAISRKRESTLVLLILFLDLSCKRLSVQSVKRNTLA